jgi:hypothetical protein
MKTYEIKTTETRLYTITYKVDANSKEEAKDLFYENKVDLEKEVFDEILDIEIDSITPEDV